MTRAAGGGPGAPPPRIEGLYGILDPAVVAASAADPGKALEEALRKALAGGCRIVQYRDKEATPRKALARSLRLAALCREGGALFIVNDRLDVALIAGAHGCHLGQEDLPAADARKVCPAGFLLGVSTHDVVEARRAEADGADYIGVGAVFPTTSKDDAREPRGLRLVAEVASAVAVPAVAIAGITRRNVREVIRAGAAGFAVISDLFGAPDVRRSAEEFVRTWEEERSRR